MGSVFNQMSVDLAAEIQDTRPDNTPITLAGQDGIKRTSAQRSAALNDARKWVILSAIRLLGSLQARKLFPASVFEATNITFSSGSANLPSDFLYPIALATSERVAITVLRSQAASYEADFNQDIVDAGGSELSAILQDGKIVQVSTIPDGNSYRLKYFRVEDLTASSTNDVTEDLMWRPAVLRYAQYLCFLRTGNTQRSQIALVEATQLLAANLRV